MPSNNPQPSLRDQVDSIIDRELNNEDGLDSVSELLQLFESTILEVINSGYAAVGKDSPALETVVRTVEAVKNIQRERLSALLGKEGKDENP